MKTTAIYIAFTLLFTACRKDDDNPAAKVYPEENPLQLYLENSGFNQKTVNYINAATYEFGYNFRPKVKGKINAVTFKIPDNGTNVRVTIWDATAKTPLRTVVIPNVGAHTEIRQYIEPLDVIAGKDYLISYSGNDWYERKKTDGSNATYPIEAGNITITGYSWLSTIPNAQIYPTNTSKKYYAGDLSIVFQQVD